MSSPARLQALISSLPTEYRLVENLFRAGEAVRALADPTIAPLTIAAAVLSLLSRCWIRAMVAWVLFLSVIIAFGLDGRPAVLHTYYPVPVLLLFASLESGLRPRGAQTEYGNYVTVFFGALAMMLSVDVSENKMLRERSQLAREDLGKLNRGKNLCQLKSVTSLRARLPGVGARHRRARLSPLRARMGVAHSHRTQRYSRDQARRDLTDRIAHDRDIPFRSNGIRYRTSCRLLSRAPQQKSGVSRGALEHLRCLLRDVRRRLNRTARLGSCFQNDVADPLRLLGGKVVVVEKIDDFICEVLAMRRAPFRHQSPPVTHNASRKQTSRKDGCHHLLFVRYAHIEAPSLIPMGQLPVLRQRHRIQYLIRTWRWHDEPVNANSICWQRIIPNSEGAIRRQPIAVLIVKSPPLLHHPL